MSVIGSGQSALPIPGVPLHSHDRWEIIYVISGSHRTRLGDEICQVDAGDVMIVPPGVLHNGEMDIPDNHPFTDIWIKVDRLEYDSAFIVHDWDGCVESLMRMISGVESVKDAGWQMIADSLAASILLFIDKYQRRVWRYGFVAEFRNYLCENLSDPGLDIVESVRKTGYNPDYFRRCFVAELGMTPLMYLTKLRIDKAKTLLSQTCLPVCEISTQCGFGDSFWFSKRFRQLTGMTPRCYRAENPS